MENSLLVETISCTDGSLVGIATLNRPQALNSLDLEMTRILDKALKDWSQQPEVVAVIFRGAGEKAFCAGGDLHSLYDTMIEYKGQPASANEHANRFFAEEYELDYLIHTYPKPIICWGDGIVMGGGMGLMAGCSHRVVTETSRLAMPEINIGLFPDVGGSWLLSRSPGHTGLFLALTGALIGASDAIYCGFADHALARDQWEPLLQALQSTPWARTAEDFQKVTDLIHALPSIELQTGPLESHRALIDRICQEYDLERIGVSIAALSQNEDKWLSRAGQTYMNGCPGTARLSWELLRRARHMSLADIFRLEFGVAVECAAAGNFQEGIRAVLIDKDRQPKWEPATLEETAGDWMAPYFALSIDDPSHPLATLGR
ncbi:enoyl-CoA hydratase/isomerase family protein [Orrella sp. 11846]|uniref:enoyl-CoA hydratase/isomerase family protein n=1 Tax=Orrella sp. 11846 TaxID=3409913 RepID=UPI003B59FA60